MNKLEELTFDILQSAQKDMPFHSDNFVRVPNPYSQGLPKNLEKLSQKRNESFLNKHVSTIEEIAHRYPNDKLPIWMKDYQNRYFKANLIGDGFFKNGYEFDMPKGTRFRQHNNEFISFGKLLGGVITSDASDLSGTGWVGNIWCAKATQGTQVIGSYYNEVALDIVTAAGNIRLGVYSGTTGGNPTNLYSESASIASPSSGTFSFQIINEFQLTDTSTWIAFQANSASLSINYLDSGTNDWDVAFTYGAFQNPRTGARVGNAVTPHLKASHS